MRYRRVVVATGDRAPGQSCLVLVSCAGETRDTRRQSNGISQSPVQARMMFFVPAGFCPPSAPVAVVFLSRHMMSAHLFRLARDCVL